MKKVFCYIPVIFILFHSSLALSQFVFSKYAGAFLRTGVGARALGLGGAYVAACEDVTSIYWNPAGLASMGVLQIHGMHAERFSGIINWDFVGIGIPLNKRAAMGFGFFRMGIDGIPVTALRDPSRDLGEHYIDEDGMWIENDVFVEKYINDHEMAFIFSYAKQQSDRLSYGGNVKVIRKSAGKYGAWGLGFDFGILWKPYRSLQTGLVLLDGSSTLIAWNGGRKELIAPHIKMGVAYPLRISHFHILPVFDIHIGFENQRSAAQISLGKANLDFQGGLEIGFNNQAALRIGSDRGYLTAGIGLGISAFQIDYGFSHHFDLGETHRISMTFFWDKSLLARF